MPNIRPAQQQDCTQIAEITNAEIISGVAHFATTPDDPADTARAWHQHHTTYPWLVATDPDLTQNDPANILGYTRAAPWKSRQAYDWTCETAVYVRHSARGKGVGRALYHALFTELEARGFRGIVAGVVIPNPASERLHIAMGMTEAGTLHNVGFKLGAWRSVRYYTKQLGDRSPPGRPPGNSPEASRKNPP